MLAWVDEASWIAASLQYPECRFVTVGMDKVEFHTGVEEGVILEIECQQSKVGKTSISYQVEVRKGRGDELESVFSTCVSFVNMGADGQKAAIA